MLAKPTISEYCEYTLRSQVLCTVSRVSRASEQVENIAILTNKFDMCGFIFCQFDEFTRRYDSIPVDRENTRELRLHVVFVVVLEPAFFCTGARFSLPVHEK